MLYVIELIDCGKPEEGSGADLVSYETTPGKTAEYTCHENKIQKQGNLTRNCLMSGEWDGEKPVCDIADGMYTSALFSIKHLGLQRMLFDKDNVFLGAIHNC